MCVMERPGHEIVSQCYKAISCDNAWIFESRAGIDFQPHYINITREFIAHRLHPCFRKCKSMHLKVETRFFEQEMSLDSKFPLLLRFPCFSRRNNCSSAALCQQNWQPMLRKTYPTIIRHIVGLKKLSLSSNTIPM